MSRARVFIASSLDGFIAGPDDDLDWLNSGAPGAEDTFTPFFAEIGALLMGRRTFEVVKGFAGNWPYGTTPVLVATARPFTCDRPSVRAVSGSIQSMLAEAKQVAAERDVYVDGGALIRSALDAGLVDTITVTLIPIVLGAGVPLFAGVAQRHRLRLQNTRSIGGGLVELNYLPQQS